jgi:hypothetical protein
MPAWDDEPASHPRRGRHPDWTTSRRRRRPASDDRICLDADARLDVVGLNAAQPLFVGAVE